MESSEQSIIKNIINRDKDDMISHFEIESKNSTPATKCNDMTGELSAKEVTVKTNNSKEIQIEEEKSLKTNNSKETQIEEKKSLNEEVETDDKEESVIEECISDDNATLTAELKSFPSNSESQKSANKIIPHDKVKENEIWMMKATKENYIKKAVSNNKTPCSTL